LPTTVNLLSSPLDVSSITQDASPTLLQIYNVIPIEIPIQDLSSMNNIIVEAMPDFSLTLPPILHSVFLEMIDLLLFENVQIPSITLLYTN